MSSLERYDPRVSGRIQYEHFHRYAFAIDFVTDAAVLDVACGEGYGSAVLSRFARRVVGVDIDAKAVAAANRRYTHSQSNQLEYIVGDAAGIPLPDASFDVVVSMETIGYLHDTAATIKEIKRVLKKNGLLIVSLPCKDLYTHDGSESDRHDANGPAVADVSELLRTSFANVALFGQRMVLASAIGPADAKNARPNSAEYRGFTAQVNGSGLPELGPGVTRLGSPEHMICVASDGELPVPAPQDSFFLTESCDLWEEHARLMQWAADRQEDDEELRARVRELEAANSNDAHRHALALAETRVDHMRELHAAQAKEIQYLSQRSTGLDLSILAPILHSLDEAPVDPNPAAMVSALTRAAIRFSVQRHRIADLEAQSIAHAADRESLHTQIREEARHAAVTEAGLRSEADALRRALADREWERDTERAARAALEEAARSAEALEADLRGEADALRKVLADRERERDGERAARAALEEAARSATVLDTGLRGEADALRRALADREWERDTERAARAALEEAARSAEALETDLRSEADALRRALADRETERDTERAARAALEETARNAEASEEALRRTLSDREAERDTERAARTSLEAEARGAEALEADLRGQADALRRTLADRERERYAERAARTTLENAARGAEALEVALRGEVDSLRKALADREQDRYAERAARLALEDAAWGAAVLEADLRGEASSLRKALADRERERDTERAARASLEEAVRSAAVLDAARRSESDSLRRDLADRERERDTERATRTSLEAARGETDASREMPETLEPKYDWSFSDGEQYYMPQDLRDYMIDRYGEKDIDLYVNLFAIIDRYENKPEAFDDGPEVEEIAALTKTLAREQHGSSPAVSIIIPVHNKLVYTLTCLFSILKTATAFSFELIVADDMSSDRTAEVVGGIGGCVRHVRHDTNVGFLQNCNAAARAAVGRYLVFLNNDTIIFPEWLDQLIIPMETDGSVGFTGSKLINGDGTLQEAGGIFWRDGSAWNFGRGQHPGLPEFNYAKDVDYISGASIAIPRALWQTLGGFDPIFAPAYCEDSDMAFRVRAAGYRTRYQPHSMLVHHEGRSHGRDLSSGIKSYQVINNAKLLGRWQKTLESEHFENAEHVFLARDRSKTKPHILVVDHYVPQWDRDAGSRTLFLYIRLFIESGFAVTFWSDNLFEDRNYTPILQNMGVEVIYSHHYINRFQEWVEENGKYLNYAFLSRPHITKNYIDHLTKFPNIKTIYYGHDLHFRRLQLEHAIKGDAELLVEAAKWEETEIRICSASNVVLYPGFEEVALVRERVPASVSVLAFPITIFSETELADAEAHVASGGHADPYKLMFVGGFSHHPNADGILWFVREVMPLIRRADARFHLSIAGSNAPDSVLELAGEGVDVLGRISDAALLDLYRTSGLAVVPLRYGAGVKGKVIEAMARGVPVAMTGVGAQGIPDAERLGFVGDRPEALAAAIVQAVNDPADASARAARAVDFIRDTYSERAVRTLMAPVMPELAGAPPTASREHAP